MQVPVPAFQDRPAGTLELPALPELAQFRPARVEVVCRPHPYCISPAHLALSRGQTLDIEQSEKRGASCATCRALRARDGSVPILPYSAHVPQLVLFVAVRGDLPADLNNVRGLRDWLVAAKDAMVAAQIAGVAFPTEAQEDARLINGCVRSGGMGGFLAPPGHPAHSFHVEYGKDDWASLENVLEEPRLYHPDLLARVRGMVRDWQNNKLGLRNKQIRAWVRQVLGYFHDCWRGASAPAGREWDASNLAIVKRSPKDTIALQHEHAGVHLIRRYYPEYVLTLADLRAAKWGK